MNIYLKWTIAILVPLLVVAAVVTGVWFWAKSTENRKKTAPASATATKDHTGIGKQEKQPEKKTKTAPASAKQEKPSASSTNAKKSSEGEEKTPDPNSPKSKDVLPANANNSMLVTMSEGPTCTTDIPPSITGVPDALACSVLCQNNDKCEASQYKPLKSLCWLKFGCTGGTVGDLRLQAKEGETPDDFQQWYQKQKKQ